jgi:hypothetical protein
MSPRRQVLAAGALCVLVTGVLTAWIGFEVGGPTTTLWVDDLATAFAAMLACVLCVRARSVNDGRMRLFWTLLAAASAAWAMAEIVWGVYDLTGAPEVPVPSWADVGYLGAVPLALAALVIHPATTANGVRRARWVLDGAVVATALLFLSWTAVLGPLWPSAELTAAGVVTIAYPFADVMIVFMIVMAIRGLAGADRLPLWCLLGALLLMALTDSAYLYLTSVAEYDSGNLIDVGWIAAYLGIALSAFAARVAAPARVQAPSAAPARMSRASLVAPLLPVLLALTVATAQMHGGETIGDAELALLIALIALVLARQVLMLVELFTARAGALSERLTRAALGADGPEPAPQEVTP